MSNDIETRVRKVISGVLGVPEATIDHTSSPETIPNWDSINHIHLMVALEGEFGISFDPDVALGLTSVPAIARAVAAQGIR
jgi:acyl carrier protein